MKFIDITCRICGLIKSRKDFVLQIAIFYTYLVAVMKYLLQVSNRHYDIEEDDLLVWNTWTSRDTGSFLQMS